MRVVADTNILISGLLFGGLPRVLIVHAVERRFTLISSENLLLELSETLGNKFHFDATDTTLFIEKIQRIAEIANPDFRLAAVPGDEDDNRVLECAVAGKADFIVSGDKHLLRLGSYEGIAILTVRQFLQTAGFRVD